ncbi:MAG: hypothetical protein AB8G99_13635, partial [Planctomycetaceae bacterium]
MLDPSQKIEQLLRLIRFRANEEGRLSSELHNRLQAAETHYANSTSDLASRLTSEIETAQAEYAELKEDIEDEFDAHYGEAQSEYKEKQLEVNREHSGAVNKAEKEFEDAKWMVNSVYDKSGEDSAMHQYELFKSRSKKEREFLETQARELDGFIEEAGTMLKLKKSGSDVTVQLPETNGLNSDELHELHVTSTDNAGKALVKLKKLWLVRQFKGLRPIILLVVLWLISVPIAFAFKGNPSQLINDFSG